MKNSLIYMAVIVLVLQGCKSNSDDSAAGGWRETLDQAKQELDTRRQNAQSAASEEVEKLFTFEYKIAEIPKESTAEEMETSLAELGKDRWECFHVERNDKLLQFFCKRSPKTVLKYIPRIF